MITITINNPVVDLFSGLVTYLELAEGTRLNRSTCLRIMHDPTACFHEETAAIVTQWAKKNIDSTITLVQLFRTANLTTNGRKPLTASGPRRRKPPEVICGKCRVPTTPSGLCSECEEIAPLAVSA